MGEAYKNSGRWIAVLGVVLFFAVFNLLFNSFCVLPD